MLVKALVILATVLAATPASAASSNPVMWFWEWAWPKAQQKHETPPPASSGAVAPKVEAKPMPSPRPKVEAKPKATPIKPQSKREQKPTVPKPRAVVKPSASQCAQLKLGVGIVGRDGVIKEAIKRKRTYAEVIGALAACEL